VVYRNARLGFVAALSPISFPAARPNADLLKNMVLVYGAWVEASGWTAVYEILTKNSFNIKR